MGGCRVCYRGGCCLVLADRGEGRGPVSGRSFFTFFPNDGDNNSSGFSFRTRSERKNFGRVHNKKEGSEEDHLFLDSRTTGQGWAFCLDFSFFSVGSSWMRGLPIGLTLGVLNMTCVVCLSRRGFLIM